MNFPPRVLRSRIPAPDNLIVKSGLVDDLDDWQVEDRRCILDSVERYADAYSWDYAIGLLVVVLVLSLIAVAVNFLTGYETDVYDICLFCVFLPLFSAYTIKAGAYYVINLYKKAMEEATNDL